MDPCPEIGALARFVQDGPAAEGSAAPQHAERIRDHLDECDDCRALVAALARGSLPNQTPASTYAARVSGPDPEAEMVAHAASARHARPDAASGSHHPTRGRDDETTARTPQDLTHLGPYELTRRLGAGGMGLVYEALDARLQRRVAIKVLRKVSSEEEAYLLAEGRALARVRHPNVVRIYDVAQHDGCVAIIMELVAGMTLRAWCMKLRGDAPEQPLDDANAVAVLHVLRQAALGLQAVHEAGILHRDFKPDNVLLEADPARRAAEAPPRLWVTRALVSDFGLSRDKGRARQHSYANEQAVFARASGSDARFMTHAAGGTPAYMAPEQLDHVAHDKRADIYAFAVTAWEALTGHRPYEADGVAELRARMTQRPPKVAVPAPAAALWPLLEQALRVDPGKRPSLDDLVHALDFSPRRGDDEITGARRTPWDPKRARTHMRPWARKAVLVSEGLLASLAAGALALGYVAQRRAAAEEQAVATSCLVSTTLTSPLRLARLGVSLRQSSLPPEIREQLLTSQAAIARTHGDAGRRTTFCQDGVPDAQALVARRAFDAIERCLQGQQRELNAIVDAILSHRLPAARAMGVGQLLGPEQCARVAPHDPQWALAATPLMQGARETLTSAVIALYQEQPQQAHALFSRAEALAEQAGNASLLLDVQRVRAQLDKSVPEAQRSAVLAAVASRAELDHLDVAAALAWTELASPALAANATMEQRFGYLERARLALHRLGDPSELVMQWRLARLHLLVEGGQIAEAESELSFVSALPTYDPIHRAGLASLRSALASQRGDYQQVVQYETQVLELLERIEGERHSDLTGPLSERAWAYFYLGKLDLALADIERALTIAKATIGLHQPSTYDLPIVQAQIVMAMGHNAAARALLERQLKALGPLEAVRPGTMLLGITMLATLHVNDGRFNEAIAAGERYAASFSPASEDEWVNWFTLRQRLAEARWGVGEFDRARADAAQLWTEIATQLPDMTSDRAGLQLDRAAFLWRAHAPAEQVIELLQPLWKPSFTWSANDAYQLHKLSAELLMRDQPEAARVHLAAAAGVLDQLPWRAQLEAELAALRSRLP